jgi:hypothetical protein
MFTSWQQTLLGLSLLLVNIGTVQGFGCCFGSWDTQFGTEQVLFPLRSMTADATIIDGIAKVSVTQYFEIVTDVIMPEFGNWKARYEIPFDEQGAINEFRATYDNRVIEGVVKSDEEAQQEFDEAIDNGQDAFLGTQTDAGVFKLEFGNVPLGVLIKVEFVYVAEVQARDRETLRFVIPSTLAPEMNPSVASSELYDNGAFTLSVKAYSSAGTIKEASCSSHANAAVADITAGGKQITLVDREQLQRRDIVLLFETEEIQELQANVYEETRSDGSTALMLSLLPDTSSFDIDSFNTEFVFLVDRSGSMAGDKILQTSLALEEVLNNLPPGSLFNFVSFGKNFEYAFEGSLSIDESSSLDEGIIFARTLSATFGSTNLINPIADILSSSPATGFQRVVMVFTDGEVSNTDQVVSHVGNNRGSTRVFSLGIGDADRELVNGIARAGGGTAEFVDSKELSLISEVAKNQVTIATQAGFLSRFNILWGNSIDGVEAPFGKDTVFADRRSLFYYLTDDIVDFVNFTASVGGQADYEFHVPRSLFIDAASLTLGGSAIVGPMGAREAIRDLEEDRSELHSSEMPDEAAIKNEIIDLGVKYQITSSETSFIAIDNQDWTSRNAADSDDKFGGGTEGSVPIPGGGLFGGVCFSGRNMVLAKERGYVRMEDVEIGDMVHVGDHKYSRVYSFGHRNHHNYAQYLQLHFHRDQPLEISHDHMVFVDKLGVVPASMVGVGDKLLLGAGGVIKVTKISTVNRQGAFAPFTESGAIVVSDILASSYVSLQEESANFQVAGVSIVSMQWLAHAFQAPHRMICRWNSDFCKTETYTEEGISKWVYGPFLASKWLLGQHVVIMAVLSVPAVMTGVVLYLVEAFFSNLALSCLAAILVLSFCNNSNNKKTKIA